jgi:hypothetical protein
MDAKEKINDFINWLSSNASAIADYLSSDPEHLDHVVMKADVYDAVDALSKLTPDEEELEDE